MENNNSTKNSFAQKALEKIKSGKIKMKPRTLFVFRALLIAVSVLFAVFIVFFLVSFVAFFMRLSGVRYLGKFGAPGRQAVFGLVPLLLFFVILGIGLVFLIQFLMKRFSITWKWPVIYSLLAILLIVAMGGIFLDKTRMHPAFFQRAQEGHLPMMGHLYRERFIPYIQDIHPGVVKELSENGFKLENQIGEALPVQFSSSTVFSQIKDLKENDSVLVFGSIKDNVIQAKGIRKISAKDDVFLRRPLPRMPIR